MCTQLGQAENRLWVVVQRVEPAEVPAGLAEWTVSDKSFQADMDRVPVAHPDTLQVQA